jgi:hypothetical protein
MTGSPKIALMTILLFAHPLAATAAPFEPGQQEKAPKKESKPSGASLTGCVDEQNGSYILTDDRELKTIATLVADGFPQEGFAKHLGHKVTVRGTATPGDPTPTFKVRSITMVSETCAPQR